jgi:uncharacterized membrane protein YgdD (TMEM256/DUF423 family)
MTRLKNWIQRFLVEASEWAEDKFAPLRLILWLFLFYIFLRHLGDPMYQSIFKPLNLGIHELGHLVFSPLGQFLMVAGGTIAQLLVPLISFFMFYRQRDYFAFTVSFCWMGTNLFSVAGYMADARKMALPLVTPFGGEEIIHDWNYLLGKMGLLNSDTVLGGFVRLLAILNMVIGLVFGAWLILKMFKKTR